VQAHCTCRLNQRLKAKLKKGSCWPRTGYDELKRNRNSSQTGLEERPMVTLESGADRPHRRVLLAGGLGVAVAALAGCATKTATQVATATSPLERAGPSTPKAAFARLAEGNKRWVTGNVEHPGRDLTRRQFVAQKQEPFGVVLACIDSRVPPELIFDTGLGDLYVMRTGGAAVGPVVTGSVEYGPLTSNSPLIVVLGHQRCGAVAAVYKAWHDNKPLPGNLQAITEALHPAYEQVANQSSAASGGDPVENMTKIHVKQTADALRANNDLAPLVRSGALAVVSAYYSLDTGEVQVLTGTPT
jgi:carbonic anhydrase